MRGVENQDYPHSKYDGVDTYGAVSDMAVTARGDSRFREVKVDNGVVYGYLDTSRYNWEFAEQILRDYSEMCRDAVVLGANDTTDTGTARYYEVDDSRIREIDEYAETQSVDGYHVGEKALSYMHVKYNFDARDPWHNNYYYDHYFESGVNRL